MKNTKIILVIIAILVICIIAITACLLILRKKTILKEDNPETVAFENAEKVTNKTLFFQIENIIEKYYIDDNTKQYNAILADEIYTIDKINNITAFTKVIARTQKAQEYYYVVVNMYYSNNTYEIIESSAEEFENAKNNQIKDDYKKEVVISKDGDNSIPNTNITDFEILKKYFADYKFNAINNPEEAFKKLDAEYRQTKFNNSIDAYKAYVQSNMNTLADAMIIKHGATKDGQYGTYEFIDNYNNYYKLKETGIYEYTIILDNYTLQSDELKQEYLKLSAQEKVLSNIDKIMKLINVKDYQTVYNYLNKDFKNTNFPSIEKFTAYMQNTFFDNNIVGNISMKEEGGNYILEVPYKESLSSAAEERSKSFVMRLGNGMNFELSFNV